MNGTTKMRMDDLNFMTKENVICLVLLFQTNRCDEGLPALLGEAKYAWLKLRRWEDFRKNAPNIII